MAPLGILTAIVGAIRVDGASWLKRLIGRARETTAGAEIELMSSVSQEVCEVWNGTSIVRSMGSPQVKQIIYLPAEKEDFSPDSFITMDRKTWSSGYALKARHWSAKDTGSKTLSTNEHDNGDIEKGLKDKVDPPGDEELVRSKELPPNISLNIHGGSNQVELVIYALIASVLQAAVLGWSSHAHKHKLSASKPSVGFPLQAIGTMLLTLSLVLCAGIIDNGSRERQWLIEGEPQVGTMSKLLSSAKSKFKALANKLRLAKDKSLQAKNPSHRKNMQLYWVQKQHIAGHNSFDPYILYAKNLTDKVHESHRAKENGQNDRDDNVYESPRPKANGQNDRDDNVYESPRPKANGQNDRGDNVHESPRPKANGQNDRGDNVHESPSPKENSQNDRGDNVHESPSPKENSQNDRDDNVYESPSPKENSQNDGDDQVYESPRAKASSQNDGDDQVYESPRAKASSQNDRGDKFLGKLLRLFGRHLTTFAVVIGVVGFVAQFQGLRFSSWTCSIAHLIALGLATILRAWVRRTMTKTPIAIPVDNNDHILDQLTLAIVGRGRSDTEFPHPKALRSPELSLGFAISTSPEFRARTKSNSKDQVQPRSEHPNQAYSEPADPGSQPSVNLQDSKEATESKPENEIQPRSEHLDQGKLEPANSVAQHSTNVQDSKGPPKKPNLAQQALDLRVRLGRITKWTGPKAREAILLSNSIEAALGALSPELPAQFGKECAVVLRVDTYRNMQRVSPISIPEEVELYITKDRGRWKVDDSQLEALLSLVSYTVWTAEHSKRDQESSRHLTKESSVKDSRSIGWLRAKAPDSRMYDIIVGKSSPRLLSDLHWWVSDTDQYLKKAKTAHNCRVTRVLADFTGPSSDAEANFDKIERPALGFYVNDGTLGEDGMAAIQRPLWRVLTCSDILCSWECKEQQAPVFHLFSTFIWAAAPYLSASKFHPSAVTCTRQLSQWVRPDFAQLRSDRIQMLVQGLQIAGLGTSEEIFKMLIPPLSHFKVLPNEAMADFWNEALIKKEGSRRFQDVFVGYSELLRLVRHREVQDRFAYRVAAMFIEFRLRVSENFDNLPNPHIAKALVVSNGHVEDLINDNTILKAIMKLNHILATRWGQQNSLSTLDGLLIDNDPGQVLRKLGLVDLLSQPQRENLSEGKFCTLDNTLMDYDFSFPDDTDVFGWTKDYWKIFEDTEPVSAKRFSECSALDIAGRSVLHNKIDRNRNLGYSKKYRACFLYGGRGPSLNPAYLSNSSIFIARCNKQTPLHRAARLGHRKITRELLKQGGTDPNAVDHCGRTALSLATYYGGSRLVRMLYDRMEPDGRARTDKEGRNALHYAVLNQNKDAALTLIEAGIEINARDHLGWPPLWYATQKDMNLVVISLLRKDEIDICILPEKNKYPTSQDSACQDRIKQIAEEIRKYPTADMLRLDSTSGDSDLSDIQDHREDQIPRDGFTRHFLEGSEDGTSDEERIISPISNSSRQPKRR